MAKRKAPAAEPAGDPNSDAAATQNPPNGHPQATPKPPKREKKATIPPLGHLPGVGTIPGQTAFFRVYKVNNLGNAERVSVLGDGGVRATEWAIGELDLRAISSWCGPGVDVVLRWFDAQHKPCGNSSNFSFNPPAPAAPPPPAPAAAAGPLADALALVQLVNAQANAQTTQVVGMMTSAMQAANARPADGTNELLLRLLLERQQNPAPVAVAADEEEDDDDFDDEEDEDEEDEGDDEEDPEFLEAVGKATRQTLTKMFTEDLMPWVQANAPQLIPVAAAKAQEIIAKYSPQPQANGGRLPNGGGSSS